MNDVRSLIKTLGGSSDVARALGVAPQVVGNWMLRGAIPASRLLDVWNLAITRGIDWRPEGAPALNDPAPREAA